MTKGGLPAILRQLRRAVRVEADDSSASDADLLGRFVDSRDGFAFEVLVRRHAALVWNVCRRVMHEEANTEDAFQAVFMTLVRKAHTIGRRGSVASWLHRVAYRVAVEAQRQAARRAAREVPVMEHHLTRPGDDPAWRELRPVLDAELCRLPEKYRAPVVLCYLQGLSNTEAARLLGCPSGTVVTRLAWARSRLRNRLTSRGLSASAGLLAAGVLQRADAAIPPGVIETTLRQSLSMAAGQTAVVTAHATTAVSLSRAATSAVSVAQVKFAVVGAACLALVGGAASLCGRQDASQPPDSAVAMAPVHSDASALTVQPIEDAPNPAADEDQPPRILAYFESADQDKITVTIRGKSGALQDRITLPVAADAAIAQNLKPLRLADLKPGWPLKIMLSSDESRVVAIRVKERESKDGKLDAKKASALRGTLKSVGRDRQITVTLQTGGADQDRTLPLAKTVAVEIDNVPAAVADLQPGMAVWFKLTPDGGMVVKIMAGKTTR